MHWFTTKTALVATATAVLAGGGTYLTQSRENVRLENQVADLMQKQQSAKENLEATQAKITSLNDTIQLMGLTQDDQNSLLKENRRLKQGLAQLSNDAVRLHQKLEGAEQIIQKSTNEADQREAEATAKKITFERFDMLKQVGLGAVLFSQDKGRLPKSYSEMAGTLSNLEQFAQFTELVPGVTSISEGQAHMLILCREKQARQLPDGRWERAYGFMDGHVEAIKQDTSNFSQFEAKHTASQ